MNAPVDLAKYRMEATKKTVNERLRELESVTRGRVDKIEEHLVLVGEYLAGTQDFFKQPFRKRLKWLLFGFYFEERAARKAATVIQPPAPESKGEDHAG